ncbi:NUDIX domain-containing protein [Elizabethkingia sp. JS20170427COW]|uniref:NUDIX hydrolase n=1 Tax=Elizabethkingia sp. JS20170427COW TaxID=2583851 RepID=UPI001110E426|nr:NUDIX domain-containing protein [Elizabethkingia sp. JS20170427COW]QCX52990.1 NUDIX domain-containing protein [Elizabethkingia sp. JS20170427COW]
MKNLRICPECGKETLSFDGRKMDCDGCGFTFYNNTAAAVAVVIKYQDEIMFTLRNQQPGKGKFDLAGGFIDFEETAEDACARELHEELNINIQPEKLKYICSLPNIYLYKDVEYHTMDLFFEYEVDEKFKVTLAEEEVSAIKWVKKGELKIEDLAFNSQKRFFEGYLR